MRQIQTCAKYLQGPELMSRLGELLKDLGQSAFVLCGNTALKDHQKDIEQSFASLGISAVFERFGGECCYEELERLKALNLSYDMVLGLGGGKVMDMAKCLGNSKGAKVVMIPTIACSDAPCSAVSVMYSQKGDKVVAIEYFKANPDLVIVDSKVIAKAPLRFLLAGIGDALSTYFDARICHENAFPNVFGTKVSTTALHLAKASWEILLEDGEAAMISCRQKQVSEALENVIEAATYLSGVGFENGGISASHSVQDMLTELSPCHEFLHGYKVAFGVFCVLLQARAKELPAFMDFCAKLGLPLCLAQLGLGTYSKPHEERARIKELMHIAFPEAPSVYHMMPRASREGFYANILLADEMGENYLRQRGYEF